MERGFLRGFCSPDYVGRFSCAVVRQQKRIVAFAVLWVSGGKEELALDLLRYDRGCPEGHHGIHGGGAHGRGPGARLSPRLNHRLVPLAGHEGQLPDPLWQRIGCQGEHFQHSDSHRRFAAALDPVWRPKYLACPGGLKTTRILRDMASLAPRGQA